MRILTMPMAPPPRTAAATRHTRLHLHQSHHQTPHQHQRQHQSEDADDVVDVATLHPVLQWDLDAVRWLVARRAASPSLEALVVATSSKVRTQDISLLLWLVFLAMLPELGLPYLWICVGNLLGVLLLQYVAQVMRPIDVDPTLHGIPSCTDPDTNGFPCVDSHMAMVVLLPVIENTQSPVAQLFFAGVVVYIGAMRLLLGARFVSQVVGSWLTGLTGIVLGNHGHVVVKSYRLTSGYNTAAIVSLIAFLMVVVGSWVENNESRVLGVTKADYMDVLGNILGSDGAPSSSPSAPARVHQLPRPQGRYQAHDNDDAVSEEQEVAGKKDSFYYLLRGIRSRTQPQRTTR